MSEWFNEKEYQDSKIKVPAGDHRVRIGYLTPKVSSKGNDMYEIILDVSGYPYKIYDYLVFMPDNKSMTIRKIGQIRDSFGVSPQIDPKTIPAGWVGAAGAARVKLVDGDPKVSFFIEKEKQDTLTAWQEVGQTAAEIMAKKPTLYTDPRFSGENAASLNKAAPVVSAASLPEDFVPMDDSVEPPFDLD